MASISAGMLLNFSGQKYRIRACQKTFCHRIIKAVALSRYNLHHACCPEPVLLGYHLLLPALVSMQHRRIPRHKPQKYLIRYRINQRHHGPFRQAVRDIFAFEIVHLPGEV